MRGQIHIYMSSPLLRQWREQYTFMTLANRNLALPICEIHVWSRKIQTPLLLIHTEHIQQQGCFGGHIWLQQDSGNTQALSAQIKYFVQFLSRFRIWLSLELLS